MSESIDWRVAAKVGVSLVRPGPKLSPRDRADAVARLRDAAPQAIEMVAAASGLPGSPADVTGVTLVVDRPGIVRANVNVVRTVTAEIASVSPSLADRLAGRATGVGAGVMLAMVATNILGQYEPFSSRLLLSAPSVEAVRSEIGANRRDFALWVCLHEQTHRHQFAAAPWLRAYMLDLMRQVISEADSAESAGSAGDGGRPLAAAGSAGTANLGLIGALTSPAASAVLDQVTALMSLLEGYADLLMDVAGQPAIPTLPAIRAAVDARRQPSRWNPRAWLGRLMGMAAKVDQYVNGKAFCEAVRGQIGFEGLNTAFADQQSLPTMAELKDPDAWIARTHGQA